MPKTINYYIKKYDLKVKIGHIPRECCFGQYDSETKLITIDKKQIDEAVKHGIFLAYNGYKSVNIYNKLHAYKYVLLHEIKHAIDDKLAEDNACNFAWKRYKG